ncbi:MAG: sulfur reduction protein DsrS [Gammaproteobacteria bacterium]
MAIELSSEDTLRLQVLLANELHAVRIDESSMTVKALTDDGERAVPLNPTGRDEQYLRAVRELLSSHVLGSPGGYPVYIRRWTRMGQTRDGILDRLLLLGEPEAVVAVVHAAGLTEELARRAWWALPTADTARQMLRHEGVAASAMGPVLAEYLVEYLPFETDPLSMAESVRLVLQPGLIGEHTRASLWGRGRQKTAYYIGFLQAVPDQLPDALPAHQSWELACERLAALRAAGNGCADQLCRILGAGGQTFLATVEAALRRPADQDVVVALLQSVESYFRAARPAGTEPEPTDMAIVLQCAEQLCRQGQDSGALGAVLEAAPELESELQATVALSMVGEPLIRPIFARSDAIGSVMRRQIEPVTKPIVEQVARLRGRG